MGVINVLPLSVINKIAAGEVIERPASVVKELVENALDAEASLVSIEIEDGGKKLIRVTDDGFGMAPDDVALAFSSHATSKLKTGEDLFFITTLGFRGEALSSIGAVSHARIVSRLRGAVEGAEAEVSGGAPEPARARGAPEGTTVEVANLFFNVPARRKFLRSAGTEFAHIVELVSRVALAHPGVAFKLTHNGREALNLRAARDRRRRLADLYGKELGEALLAVDSGGGPLRVTGYVAPPTQCRSNTKMQLTYVNGRPVRDRRLGHAIASGYEGMLVRGRFPVVFLFVQVDPRQVDVNVHPTKIEVRFHQAQIAYKTVLNAVREALRGADLAPVLGAPEASAPARAPGAAVSGAPRRTEPSGLRTPFDRPLRAGAAAAPPGVGSGAAGSRAAVSAPAPAASGPAEPICFQVQNAYIVEERPDGLAIIDQHALHERVIFQEIQERLARSPLESQRLLIPPVVEVSKAEAARLLAEREALAELGIELAAFGPDTVAINSLPVVLGGCGPEAVLHDVLAELSSGEAGATVAARKLGMAKLIACKAAVKAGDALTVSEMRSLLKKASRLPESDTCPHGRPACIFFPYAELERQFKRQ